MKPYLPLIVFLLMSTTILAQNENVKFVVGVESEFILQNSQSSIKKNGHYTYGVNLEYPINKFSLGVGLLHTIYEKNNYNDFTGDSFIDEDGYKQFSFYPKEFQLNYIVLSNRFMYRLPCNCVFFYAAYDLAFLGWITENKIVDQLYDTREQPYDFEETANLKNINTSLGFGIGFKLHINKLLRIIMRPTYYIAQGPSKNVNRFYESAYRYFKVNFGLQLGFERIDGY